MKHYFYKLVSNYNGKPVILDEQFTREDANLIFTEFVR